MASTANDEAFHEIQLNGKQLVFLFMAGTVVCVVIFLCGVLVGRGVRGERLLEDPLAGAATPAAAPADAPPVVAPPVAAAPSGMPATAGEDLNYPKQLTSAAAPVEKLSEPTPPAETKKPERVPAAPARAADAPVPAPAEVATPGFAIQLAALRQRDEADDIVKRLMGKGYPAYVIPPEEGAPAVFRVRVGNFKERREAATVAARLQKEEQFNPWIVR